MDLQASYERNRVQAQTYSQYLLLVDQIQTLSAAQKLVEQVKKEEGLSEAYRTHLIREIKKKTSSLNFFGLK